jgi:hypothetical protein
MCDTLSWIETDEMKRKRKDIAVDAICLEQRGGRRGGIRLGTAIDATRK